MPAITQKNRLIAIGTPLGDDVLSLVGLTGHEEIGRLFQFQAELVSEDLNINFDKIIGENVTIRLETERDKTRFFNGYVASFTQSVSNGRHARYQATIVPWLWLLTRTSDCRIYQNQTIPQIIQDVFKGSGISQFELRLTGKYQPWEYCVQYRETHFNFVSRLMEQEGIYYFFKHENGKHSLVLCDSPSAHEPSPGYEDIKYRPEGSRGRERENIMDWVTGQELQTCAYAHTDFDFKTPAKNLLATTNVNRKHAFNKLEFFDYPGEYIETDHGKADARVRIQEIQSRYAKMNGTGDTRGMRTGSTFNFKEFPRSDQCGNYLILSTNHSAHTSAFESGDRNGGSGEEFYHCAFTVMDSKVPFRPARITPKPIVQGPQTAMVVGPSGEEIHTDEHGRVKVKFHWDRYSKGDDTSSCWIRVSQAWAGKQWGSFYLPRVGQEVIVEFLEGDPDQPIITGRVYNGEATPPYKLPDEKTKSTIKSNSTKGGQGFNEFRFEDKKGEEQIFIHAQHNMDVRVRNTLKETVYGNREIRVGWEKDGESGGSLNTLVKLDVNQHIKGGKFDKIEKDLNQTVQGEVTQDFQKGHSTKVTGTRTLNAKEVVVEASDAISEKTGKFALEASQEVGIKGGVINLESSQGVSLKCGGNFLTIDPSGVAINGTMVLINSGGAANPAASAKAAQLPDLETPLEARVADDGKTGHKSKGHSAKPRVREKISLKPLLAPPYKALSPLNGPVAQGGLSNVGPVANTKVACAGPYKMTDHERKGDRSANEANGRFNLELVPESLFGGDTIVIKASGGCNCRGATITVGDIDYALNAPAKVSAWSVMKDNKFELMSLLGSVSPRQILVKLTCGKDKSEINAGEIWVYPNDKIEVKAELEEIVEKCPSAASMLQVLAKGLSLATSKSVDPYKGIHFQAGLGLVIVAPPQLSLGYEAQWKEYECGSEQEWRVHYAWKASLAVALSVEFMLDVLAVAAASTGVGAPIIKLANWVKEQSGQDEPLIFLSFKAEVKGNGALGYEQEAFGSLDIKGTGTVSIGAMLSIKDAEQNDIFEAKIDCSSAVSSSVTGKAFKTKWETSYELFKWEGVKGKASVKFHVGKFFAVGYEEEVQLIDGGGPWSKGDKLFCY